jgi:3-hydroxybutyryl-CoA dehydrogenase
MQQGDSVAVVGGGTMGCGVAQCLSEAGYRVVVYEPDADARATGPRRLREGVRLARLLRRGKGNEAASAVEWVDQWEPLAPASFVLECAPERIPLKESVLATLDQTCRPDTVFASVTSAITIDRLASATERPGLVLGMHFMNPAPLKDTVEVVQGPRTHTKTVDTAVELLASMGKKAIVVSDGPGFVTNRVLMLTVNEAAGVVERGTADAATVDEIFQECFGHPMGPLRTADLIGLDTIVDTLDVLLELTGDERFRPCELLKRMVREGDLGRKSGKGFHRATRASL